MALGQTDIKDIALPSLWDAATLTQVQLESGESLDSVAIELQQVLQLTNNSLLQMENYAGLFSVTTEASVEYPVGTTNGFQVMTDYATPNPGRGKTSGHMLPLIPYFRGLGWTVQALRKSRRAKIEADLMSVVKDAKHLWQKELLKRFFTSAGKKVGSTSNADVPFADGGTVDSSYIPPDSPDGEAFANTHNHFLRHASLTNANLTTAIEHLNEHGHDGPYDAIIPRADVATWSGIDSGWTKPERPGILYNEAANRVSEGAIGRYLGYVETDYGQVRVWDTPRVPTNYYGVYKMYGQSDQRNPLRVRYSETVGFGYNLLPGVWLNMPSQLLVPNIEFGVGVGADRTNGVCVYINASGNYTDPTIS